MKNFVRMCFVAALAMVCASDASAARGSSDSSAGIGFDMLGSYYMPTDTRYQGIGMGYAMNIKLDDNFSMGYRVEELQVRAEDGAVTDNHVLVSQGLTAYFRTMESDRLAIDFGLWMGAVSSSDFDAGGTTAISSPFIAPMGRAVYTSMGRVETHVSVGVGYRFIRRATIADPFNNGGEDLKNLDGLELNFGVGLAF